MKDLYNFLSSQYRQYKETLEILRRAYYNFMSLRFDYIAAWFNDQAILFDKKANNQPGDEHETGYNKDLPWFVKDLGPPPRRR